MGQFCIVNSIPCPSMNLAWTDTNDPLPNKAKSSICPQTGNAVSSGPRGHYAIVVARRGSDGAKTHYFHYWYPGICPERRVQELDSSKGNAALAVCTRGFSARCRARFPPESRVRTSRPLVRLFPRSLSNHFRISSGYFNRTAPFCDKQEFLYEE